MVEERRQYVRWRDNVRVTYSFTGEDKLQKEIFAEDFSEGGLQILTSDKMEPQQRLRLRLEFVHDVIPIIAIVQVAYVNIFKHQYQVGLEFVEINDFDKQRIKRCLEKIRGDFKSEAQEEDV